MTRSAPVSGAVGRVYSSSDICSPHTLHQTTGKAAKMTEDTKLRPPARSATYWLIVKDEMEQEEMLTVGLDAREEALPIFCFEEEASMFLSLETLEAGWKLTEATAGELVSTLFGSCADVGFVALDPLPELVRQKMVGLVSVRREHFLDSLAERV